MNVRVTDRGYAALIKRLTQVKPTTITVGIHEEEGADEHGEEGMTVADIGAVHEYGLGTSPRRSFIADWVEENREAHTELIRNEMRQVMAGKQTLDQAAARVGVKLEGDCKKRLTATPGDWGPLDEATIARKGSSKPLIDTGVLRASITHKVEKGG